MNKLFLVGIIGLSLFTVGCGSKEADSGDVVIEDTVNIGYYHELKEYNEKMADYLDNILPLLQGKKENDEQKIIDMTNEFLLYSKSTNLTPLSEEDKLMDDSFKDLKYDIEKFTDYTLQYIYKGDEVYFDFMQDSINNVKIHLDAMTLIEDKYYSEYK